MCTRVCTFLPAPLATAAAGASARCRRHSRQAESNLPRANAPKAPLPRTARRATQVSARAQRSAGRRARRTRSCLFVCLFACSREGARGHHRYDRAEPGTPPTPQTLNPKPALPANATPRVACGATLRAGTGSPVAATQDTVRHGRNAERCVSLRTWGLVAYAHPRGLVACRSQELG